MIYNKYMTKRGEKMKEIVFPNYHESILNTMSTIMNHYGLQTDYQELPILKEALNKHYKNIVLMVFDGMGVEMLKRNLKADDLLNREIKQHLTSVFPSTTTAAMTAYYAGKSPNEHGWLGWSLYFKEYGRCIDTFINTDSYSGEVIDAPHAGYTLMPYRHVLDQIEDKTAKTVRTYMIEPAYIKYRANNTKIGVESAQQLVEEVRKLCEEEGSKFIFSYWPDPDKTMHSMGCYSSETVEKIQEINTLLNKLYQQSTDTLFIISADHGLIDVEKTTWLNDYPTLTECFLMPPSIEKRAVSFFIKPEYKNQFKEQFNHLFKNEFILLTKEEAFEKNIFGLGVSHAKALDFVGDFLACAIGTKVMGYQTMTQHKKFEFSATHAGLTEEEMIVPLIILES